MLDATKTYNGSFGKLYDADGNWLTNINKIESGGEVSKEEVPRSGTRVKGHKVTGITYSGTISGYKISTAFARKLGVIKNSGAASLVTSLVYKLNDPDSPEKIWIRYIGVQFDVIPLLNSETEALVMEELPFTFSDYEYL